MADEEETIEIAIKLEKAKASLGDLKDELEKLRRDNGEITLGLVGSAAGAGLQSAAGQTGSSIAGFVQDPVGASIKAAVEGIAQQFPHLLSVLDTISGGGAAARVAPIAEQYARLTGQQLPSQVLGGLVQQAQGPEQAAAEARRRTSNAASPFSPDGPLVPFFQRAFESFDDVMRKYWGGGNAPHAPQGGR